AQDHDARKAKLDGEEQSGLETFELKKGDALGTLRSKYDAALTKAKTDYQTAHQQAVDEYNAARTQLEADFKESRWTQGTVKEADTKNSQDQLQQQQQDAGNQVAKIEANRKKAVEVLAGWKLEVDEQSPPAKPSAHEDAWAALQAHVDT